MKSTTCFSLFGGGVVAASKIERQTQIRQKSHLGPLKEKIKAVNLGLPARFLRAFPQKNRLCDGLFPIPTTCSAKNAL